MHQAFHDHRHDPVALGGTLRGDGPGVAVGDQGNRTWEYEVYLSR